MDVVSLTRKLVDIESITGNEAAVGDFLHFELQALGYHAQKMPVEDRRHNVWATLPEQSRPAVVFSTHMDTVPPFIPSSEDATRIFGRGSCDAKGIIAAQIAAAERLRSLARSRTHRPGEDRGDRRSAGCARGVHALEGAAAGEQRKGRRAGADRSGGGRPGGEVLVGFTRLTLSASPR